MHTHTFGQVERTAVIERVYPYLCLILAIAPWFRYPIQHLATFSIIESLLITSLGVSLFILYWTPSLLVFLGGVTITVVCYARAASVVQEIPGSALLTGLLTGLSAFNAETITDNLAGLDPLSPNAALVIALLAISTGLSSFRSRGIVNAATVVIVSSMAVALCAVTVWSHLFAIPTGFRWGDLPEFPLTSSVMLLGGAVLVLILTYHHDDTTARPSARTSILAIGIAAAIGSTLLYGALLGTKPVLASNSGVYPHGHNVREELQVPVLILLGSLALAWGVGLRERLRMGQHLIGQASQTTEALETEGLRFKLLAELAGDALLVCDSNEKVDYVNAAGLRFLGAQRLRAATFLSEILPQSVYAALRSSAILHPRSKNEWKSEVQLPGEKGELRSYNIRIAPALRGSDAVMGFCLSISPVHRHDTNSTTTPSVSKADNERWYHLLDGFEIPLWIAQKDGTIEFGNRKLRDFLGVTSDHFTRTWPLEFCHKDDVPGFVAAGARLGTNRRRIQNTAGYLKWFSESITAVKSETGEVLNYVGALVECGKERRLEEVARSLRETVNILFKTKRVVYWLHDLSKKRVTAVSAGFDALFGISADELLIEPNIWAKVPNPHVVVPEQVSEEGSPISYAIPKSDGSSVLVNHTIYPLQWDDGVDGERFYIHVVEPSETI